MKWSVGVRWGLCLLAAAIGAPFVLATMAHFMGLDPVIAREWDRLKDSLQTTRNRVVYGHADLSKEQTVVARQQLAWVWYDWQDEGASQRPPSLYHSGNVWLSTGFTGRTG